ncbi:FAD-dependent oxidoreductase, partial [Streptomyces sp. URMC 124]|uniref:FAD-dependent oxidoreductase n=1 Tax=Streptomyces sp. URMC 124 TaxID=3423405 RepID=UPI003F52E72C
MFAGQPVRHIDAKRRFVETASGLRATYDALILATGSSPFIPPIPGTDKEGVISFRTIDDCERMSE